MATHCHRLSLTVLDDKFRIDLLAPFFDTHTGSRMDPLHFAIAMGPLAVYFFLLGIINLSRRPFVTTGARDTAALGIAVCGFVVAGPMELFMPAAAAAKFEGWVWLLLIAFYGLCLTLLVLLMRPRLVVYNTTVNQLHPMLDKLVNEIDSDARWAGNSLVIPHLGVQLHIESFPALRNVQLVATTSHQNFNGWRELEIGLTRALKETRNVPNPYGFFLISFGSILALMISAWLVSDGNGVVQALGEMLRH